jgi:DNA-binding LacI/PurR family transcriptional regulator
MEQPFSDIGQKAVQILLDGLPASNKEQGNKIILPVKLILRQSTASPVGNKLSESLY